MSYFGDHFGTYAGDYFGSVTSGGFPKGGAAGFANDRANRRGLRIIRVAVETAEDILSAAGITADKPSVVAKAAEALAPALTQEEAEWASSRVEAIKLQSERLSRERAQKPAWQVDLAAAALIMEFRIILSGLEAAWMDDEDAITVLLLA